jgi:multidrug efflux system membrane fusion protein
MQINKNVKIAGAFAGLAVLWMLTGAFKEEEKLEKKAELGTVKVLANKVSPIVHTPKVEVVGRTEVSDEVDLVAEVSGKVSKVNFSQGDFVKSTDLMLELENDYRKDNLDSAKEEMKSAKLKLDIAQNLAQQAYKAKTDLADRQAEYTRSLSNFTNAKRDYENSFVKAPISGFIEEKNVSLGDYVKEDTVLYKIISQDEMLLVGYLSQNQIGKVKLGQKAYGTFVNGKTVEGQVTFISQKADELTKTYKMEVTVKKQSDKFRVIQGLTVSISIPGEDINVYKIPHSAMVIADDGKVGIRSVNAQNVVEFKEAKLVKDTHNAQFVTIEKAEGDLNLITRGQIDVKEGLTVDVSFTDENSVEIKKEEK